MKRTIFVSLIFATAACTKSVISDNDSHSSTTVQSSKNDNTIIVGRTKFGCMINGNFDNDGRVAQAKKLHVDYVRSGITMTEWTGRSWSYEAYVDNGIKVVLNVNYAYTDLNTSKSAPFPKNLISYRQTFTDITNTYQPELIVVENEEINKNTHSGPMSDYINMLKVALDVCHAKGIKVTNGGIYGPQLEVLTYRYLQTKGQKRADSFANNCMTTGQVNAAKDPGSNPSLEKDVRQLDTLLNFYPNLDYVNIHPYEPYDPDVIDQSKVNIATPVVLADFQEYLKARTGRPTITNETGQRNNTSPTLVTTMLQQFDQLNFPYAIWYSGEDDKADAKPLYDLNTGVLHSNGISFSNYNLAY